MAFGLLLDHWALTRYAREINGVFRPTGILSTRSLKNLQGSEFKSPLFSFTPSSLCHKRAYLLAMLSFAGIRSINSLSLLSEVTRTPFITKSRYIRGTHFHTRRMCFDSSSEFHSLHSSRPAPIKYALPPTRHLPKPFLATRTGNAYFGDLIPGWERLPYDRRWVVLRRSYSISDKSSNFSASA